MSERPVTAQRALEMIASAAPTLHHVTGDDRICSVCAAHIDLAREALGMAPLPAAPGTPLAGQVITEAMIKRAADEIVDEDTSRRTYRL